MTVFMDLCIFGCVLAMALLTGSVESLLNEPSPEYLLQERLKQNYHANIRPATDNKPIPVTFDIAVNQVLDLDEPLQVMKTGVWLRLYWKDDFLTWNSSEYGGVTSVMLNMKEIWHPDITLYNEISTGGKDLYEEYKAVASSDGSMVWFAPKIQYSSCALTVTYFPFDTQICEMKFGSWNYNGFDLDLFNKTSTGDLAMVEENAEWVIRALPVQKRVFYYSCCPAPYPSLHYFLILERKSMYYIFNLILPATFLTFTGMLVFILPSHAGEKITLSLTVLLATTVFLLIVSEILPPQSDSMPLITLYFLVQLGVLALSSIVSVFISRVHWRGSFGDRCPFWLRKFALGVLAKLFCLQGMVDKVAPYALDQDGDFLTSDTSSTSPLTQTSSSERNGNGEQVQTDGKGSKKQPPKTAGQPFTFATSRSPSEEAEMDDGRKEQMIEREWHLAAYMLDWFSFVFFVIATAICLIAVLFSNPDKKGDVYFQHMLDKIISGEYQ